MENFKENFIRKLEANYDCELRLYKINTNKEYEFYSFETPNLKDNVKTILNWFINKHVKGFDFDNFAEINDKNTITIINKDNDLIKDPYLAIEDKLNIPITNMDNISMKDFKGYALILTNENDKLILFKNANPVINFKAKNLYFSRTGNKLKPVTNEIIRLYFDFDFISMDEYLCLITPTAFKVLDLETALEKNKTSVLKNIKENDFVTDHSLLEKYIKNDKTKKVMLHYSQTYIDIYKTDFERFKADAKIYKIEFNHEKKAIITSKEEALNFIYYMCQNRFLSTLTQKTYTAFNPVLDD